MNLVHVHVSVTKSCSWFNIFFSPLLLYIQFANDFGDLIKKVLSCFRENDPNKWYRIILKTLQTEYTALLEEGDEKIDHTTAEWADLKVCTFTCIKSKLHN